MVFTTLFGSYAPASQAAAATLTQTLTDWVLDEATGYLYAISKDTGKLLFIRTSDLTVEREIVIGTAPTDIDLQAGKLYIPLSGATVASAAVVDVATQSLEKTLTLSAKPFKTALDGDKLFYVDSGSWAYLYVHNLSTGTNTKIGTTSYSSPELAVDPAAHLLYLTESGTSGADGYAFRTTDHAQVSKTTYDNGYGFSNPQRKLTLDNGALFFAGRQLSNTDLSVIRGDYTEHVLAANGSYVISQNAVYDRHAFVKVGTLPTTASLAAVDSTGQAYLFNSSTRSLQTVQLAYGLPTSNYQHLGSKIVLDKKLNDWAHDEANGYLYAISRETNRLLFIRLSDFTVETELFVGSQPMDVELAGGKLYVALSGATAAAVVDLATKTVEKTVTLKNTPSDLAVAGNKVYYAELKNGSGSVGIQEHDMAAGTYKTVGSDTFYNPSLIADPATSRLYVGDSGTSSSRLAAYRTADNVKLGQTSYKEGSNFSNAARSVIADGTRLFYGGVQLDAGNLSRVSGTYTLPYDAFTLVKGSLVYTKSSVYDRDTFVKIASLPVTAQLTAVDASYTYLYEESTKSIHRVQLQPTLTAPVYQAQTDQIVLDRKLSDWVYDASRGYLYGISTETNRLLFIRLSDFTVEKDLHIGSQPSDIEMTGGKLYIPLSGATSIAVVDLTTQALEKTLTTTTNPFRAVVDGNKLIFITDASWAYLYEYDLTTNAVKKLTTPGSYSDPDLTLDPVTHTLYLGESNTSGGDVTAIRTTDYAKLHQSTYNDGSGFSNPSRKVIVEGGHVFYAGSQFDAGKLSVINGSYNEQLIAVTGHGVFSKTAVYDRNTFVKRAALPVTATLAVTDTANNTYLFDETAKSIRKVQLTDKLPVGTYTPANNRLNLPFKLIDWVYDEQNDTIYAISQDGNRLLYLNAGTLEVTREVFVGSAPSDIDLVDGKLYIALSGATKAVVYDAATAALVTAHALDHNPYRLEVTADKLFSAGYDQGENLRTYNLLTGAISKLSTSYYQPELLVDRTTGKLYVGESGLSGSDLLALRTTDLTEADRSNYDGGYGFSYPARFLQQDGNDLYFAKHRLSASALNTVLTTYPEQIIGAKGSRVFSATGIYDRDSALKTYDLPYSANLVAVRPNGSFLTYSQSSNAIFLDVAPQLIGTTPTDGEKGFPVDKSVTIQFTEAVQTGPAFDQISFADASGQEVKINADFTGHTLTLTPDMPLAFDAVYTVTIPAGAVMDGPGQSSLGSTTFSFTTAPVQPKDELPAVTTAQTVDGVTVFTFSEAVTTGKAYDVIELTDANGNRVAISIELTGTTLTVTPKAPLVVGAPYTVFLPAASVQDATGNAMAAAYTHGFTYC